MAAKKRQPGEAMDLKAAVIEMSRMLNSGELQPGQSREWLAAACAPFYAEQEARFDHAVIDVVQKGLVTDSTPSVEVP